MPNIYTQNADAPINFVESILTGDRQMPEADQSIIDVPETDITNMTPQQLPVFNERTKKATLIHNNSQLITREELHKLPTPDGTPTWRPVAFSSIVWALFNELDKRGVTVTREQLAVSHDAMKLFATFDLAFGETNEYNAAIGLRSSNNKSISIQIAVGARVFVCDNMSFSGDLIALQRKHTSRLNIDESMHTGLNTYFGHQANLQLNIARMKNKLYDNANAEHMIFHAFDNDVLPVRLFHPVIKSYREVRGQSFISAWQLHNCFTLHAHQLPQQRKFKATIDIGTMFNL